MGIKERFDNFLSQITGHGVINRDKVESFTPKGPPFLSDEELAWLYDGNDLISNMCNRPGLEMLREGFRLAFKDEEDDPEKLEQAETVLSAFDDFGLKNAFYEGFLKEAIFGGAIMVLFADDGANIESPLRLDDIREFKGARVYDRRYLEVKQLFDDPKSPNHGEPELFLIRSYAETAGQATLMKNEAIIHASRCIVFPGLYRANVDGPRSRDGFGMSMIEKTHDAFRAHSISWSGVTHLMSEVGQGVWGMKGYYQALADNKEDMIMNRIGVADYAKSTVRSVLIDADGETYERKPFNLSGISDVLREFNQRICAAADQPATVLFGMSPAGLNATGENDRKLFNDKIKAKQESILAPKLNRVIDVLTNAKNGPTNGRPVEDWSIVFNSLEQLSELEESDRRLKQAQTDAISIDKGIALPEEIALSRFRPTGYSTETHIDRDMRIQALEDEQARDTDEEAAAMQAAAMQAALKSAQMAPPPNDAPPEETPDDNEP